MTDYKHIEEGNVVQYLKDLSRQSFLSLGLNHVAFIKPVAVGERVEYSIYAADGTFIMNVDDFEKARVLVQQNDLELVAVH